jgi:hypothetical protein
MESNWASYVGMVTGIVGALTGIAGSIMGYIAYCHSNVIKKSDRRLELDKLRNAAHVSSASLADLLTKALQSRKAVLNARGMFHSSVMEQFQAQYDKDMERAAEHAKRIPNVDVTFQSLSRNELEKQIVEIDRTKRWIDELIGVYQGALAEDEKARAEIRAHAQSRR